MVEDKIKAKAITTKSKSGKLLLLIIGFATLAVTIATLVFVIITFTGVNTINNARPVLSLLAEDKGSFVNGNITVIDKDSVQKSGYSNYVKGKLKNESGETIKKATLYLKAFNKEGQQISVASESITGWKSGDSWSYTIYKSSTIDHYEISFLEVTF